MTPAEEALFRAALAAAGIPASFAVTTSAQVVARDVIDDIAGFVRVFDRVTTRPGWQDLTTRTAPPIARMPRGESCFFSAWDFHLPPGRPQDWRLIEFNDNGSGMLMAAHINAAFHAHCATSLGRAVQAPNAPGLLMDRIDAVVSDEALRFLGHPADGARLIVDEADVLESGRFRAEIDLLCADWRARDRRVIVAAPQDLGWDGARLTAAGARIDFVVNRSTDFHWEASHYEALRAAYASGTVYVAPNPFSYATRSDKGTLEILTRPDLDAQSGIAPAERELLDLRVPATLRLRPDNLEAIAARKNAYFFKPLTGYASRGVHPASEMGLSRLKRLLRDGAPYVAQALAPKATATDPASGATLWTDLRVWAWRGEILALSGRASTHPHRIDLSPPGGWMPTYAAADRPAPS